VNLTVGDGFKLGCGIALAFAFAGALLVLVLTLLAFLATLLGVHVPVPQG
jgi:hypothetical protein